MSAVDSGGRSPFEDETPCAQKPPKTVAARTAKVKNLAQIVREHIAETARRAFFC